MTRSLSLTLLILTATTFTSGAWSLRGLGNGDTEDRTLHGCGPNISAETLAALGLADCSSLVDDSNKGDVGCVDVPGGCPHDCGTKDCLTGPNGVWVQCGDKATVSKNSGINEDSLKVICNREIAVGDP